MMAWWLGDCGREAAGPPPPPGGEAAGTMPRMPSHTDPLARLAELGIQLPAVTPPAGSYVPALRAGDFVYVSGQVPIADGKLAATGKVGADVTAERANELARLCAIS